MLEHIEPQTYFTISAELYRIALFVIHRRTYQISLKLDFQSLSNRQVCWQVDLLVCLRGRLS